MVARRNDNTKSIKKQYGHLSQIERGKIKALEDAGYGVNKIAVIIGRSPSTISRELKRGTVIQMDTELRSYGKYYPDYAQEVYEKNRKKCVKKPIYEKATDFLKFAEEKIKNEKWSPDAVVGFCKISPEWAGYIIPSTKTLYNYIDQCRLRVRNIDLELKTKRKVKKKYNHEHKRVLGESIEKRPESIEKREIAGHWEIDTVIGKQRDRQVLLTLTERKTRYEIICLIEGRKAESVNKAIKKFKREYKENFTKIFKSITADNGSEFAKLTEILTKEECAVYYAHPYSSWERGSNERQNGIIRRFIPKGKSMDELTKKNIKEVEKWCNKYPRKILKYKTPADEFMEEFR